MQGIYNFVFDRIQLNPLKLHFDKTAFMERTLEISRTGLTLLRCLAELSIPHTPACVSNFKSQIGFASSLCTLTVLASIIYINFDRR